MRRLSPACSASRSAAILLLTAIVAGCAEDRPESVPTSPVSRDTSSASLAPVYVSVATCGATVASSAGRCLPAKSLARGRSYGIWRPDGKYDTCPQNLHDAFWTLGPDGKAYPTWHPPTMTSGQPGAGCSFGHEHGRDPAGSALAAWGLPFGYVNEYFNPDDPASQRNEDHVGHKVDWENGWTLTGRRDGVPVTIRGDVMMKLHQGTHSRDALTNNLHELFYYLRLEDGSEIRLRLLNGFGSPGNFKVECINMDPRGGNLIVPVGPAVPANSPPGREGARLIPSVEHCPLLVPEGQSSNFGTLGESWQSGAHVSSAATNDTDVPLMVAHADPYFQVHDPARVHTADAAKNFFERTVNLCYAEGAMQARGVAACDSVRALGPPGTVTWNDPRSPFRGAVRQGDVGMLWFYNSSASRVWYTTPFRVGTHPWTITNDATPDRPDPSTGRVIEQIVFTKARYDLSGGAFPLRDYGAGHRVHAPN